MISKGLPLPALKCNSGMRHSCEGLQSFFPQLCRPVEAVLFSVPMLKALWIVAAITTKLPAPPQGSTPSTGLAAHCSWCKHDPFEVTLLHHMTLGPDGKAVLITTPIQGTNGGFVFLR